MNLMMNITRIGFGVAGILLGGWQISSALTMNAAAKPGAVELEAATSAYHAGKMDEAARLFAAACDKGEPRGCTAGGTMMAEGLATPVDLAGAARAYERACTGAFDNGNDGIACGLLGFMAVSGELGPPDEVQALGWHMRGCELELAESCEAASSLLLMGSESVRNEAAAYELLTRRCGEGVPVACSDVGLMHHVGMGVPADGSKAIAPYTEACEGGIAIACSNLGLLYADGNGVAKDEARSRALFKAGCDGGDVGGCASLGHVYFNGIGVAPDKAFATELFKMSCEGGNPDGCKNLAYAQANP